MKRCLTVLFLISYLPLQAQIQIGSKEIPTLNSPGRISKAQLKRFKQTTTLFTLQHKDYKQKERFKKAISSVWKITPFKIITPDELKNYHSEDYSVFSFGGYSVYPEVRKMSIMSMHLSYDLWMPDLKKKGKVKQHYLARIWLYLDSKSIYSGLCVYQV